MRQLVDCLYTACRRSHADSCPSVPVDGPQPTWPGNRRRDGTRDTSSRTRAPPEIAMPPSSSSERSFRRPSASQHTRPTTRPGACVGRQGRGPSVQGGHIGVLFGGLNAGTSGR